MKLFSVLAAFAALAAVDAKKACPAKHHGSKDGPLGPIVDTRPADDYGRFPNNGPNVGWTDNTITNPNWKYSTSDDCRRNPNARNSPDHRGNWAPGFDINTDTTTKWPNTGKTNYATWTITNTTFSPDGGPEQVMMLVNNQYPGPLLEGNWGDFFEVTVINQLQNNGTGIHWHGFRHPNNNPADGAAGITECPIPPGGQKTYRFQATAYGTSWYHSHFGAQWGAGIVGPILVHGPASANYDIDLGNVLVTDWFDLTIFQEEWFAHRFGPPQAANFLVNGRNIKPDLSAGIRTQFKFTPGKKHLLRFVNTAIDTHFKISLDGHKLLVISNDNTPIIPYYTTEISIGIGQRYDVVIVADQAVSSYYLRTVPAPGCSFVRNDGLGTANAYITYDGAPSGLPPSNSTNTTSTAFASTTALASATSSPTGGSSNIYASDDLLEPPTNSSSSPIDRRQENGTTTAPPGTGAPPAGGPPAGGPPAGGPPAGGPPASPSCQDEPLASLVPIVTRSVDPSGFAAQFSPLPVNLQSATLVSGERVFLWYINGISANLDWSRPAVSEVANNPAVASAANVSALLPKEWNTITLEKEGAWTFWVIQNQFFVPHPMHLHGHDFSVLGSGAGTFDPDTHMSQLNFKDPTRRDVVMLNALGWTVIAFEADNPGAWVMHCHIAFHVGEGLSVSFIELPQQMPSLYGEECGKGSAFEDNCAAWDDYVPNAVYVKHESGLKTRQTPDEQRAEAMSFDALKRDLILEHMASK